VAEHGADLLFTHLLVVDVQLQWTDCFAVLARALLGELDAEDVGSGGRDRRRDAVLRRDAEEVIGVGECAVLDEQGVPTEPGPVGEDDPFGVRVSSTSARTLYETPWTFAAERSGISLVFG
jgi:hypothetical protein